MNNVLHIIESSETGGAETVFLSLISNINKERFKPYIGLMQKGWLYDEVIKKGFTPTMFFSKGAFDLKNLLLPLVKFVRNNEIKLIHSHLFGIGLYSSVVGKICGVPSISTIHGTVDVDSNDKFRKFKFKLMNACSREIIYVSKNLEEYFLNLKLADKKKSTVVYNGIEMNRFKNNKISDFRKELNCSDRDFIVGSIGDIRQAKGYHVLIKAAAAASKTIPNIKFLVAGSETPLLDTLLRQQKELGVEDIVKFVGFIEDVPKFLNTIDIFLLPSISEGFSLTCVEAMAFGLPVIATKSGGPEEIVTHNEDGLLVDIESPEQIVEALFKLREEIGFSKTISNNARKNVQNRFSLNKMVENYQNIYRSILGN